MGLFLSLLTLSPSLFSAATCKPYPHPREDEVFQVCAMHSLMNWSCGILGLPHRVFVHVDFVHADARLTVDVPARLPQLHPSSPISYIMWLLEVTPKALCKQGFMGWMWAMYYIVRHLAAYIAFIVRLIMHMCKNKTYRAQSRTSRRSRRRGSSRRSRS